MAKAMSKAALERLVTPEELAETLGIEVETLYKWRLRGYGPEGIRIGKYLRYRPSAVEAFLREREADSKVA
jgi:predicted DNA-binding transcriptional regulator AlpA